MTKTSIMQKLSHISHMNLSLNIFTLDKTTTNSFSKTFLL